MKRRTLFALFLSTTPALAHSFKFGDVAIGHAWALVSAGAETSAMMPLFNSGSTADSLIGAHTDAATSVELREANRIVLEFPLEPNKPLPMRAAAKHLHLVGLKKTLVKGDRISMTLKFKRAGEITVELHINDTAGE